MKSFINQIRKFDSCDFFLISTNLFCTYLASIIKVCPAYFDELKDISSIIFSVIDCNLLAPIFSL
jgi:hypothetical protein